jgi:hypothetical protein
MVVVAVIMGMAVVMVMVVTRPVFIVVMVKRHAQPPFDAKLRPLTCWRLLNTLKPAQDRIAA